MAATPAPDMSIVHLVLSASWAAVVHKLIALRKVKALDEDFEREF